MTIITRHTSRLDIQISKLCNLHCSYCYVENEMKLMDGAQGKAILLQFLEAPGYEKEVVIYGGEPFLSPLLLQDIVDFLLSAKIIF